MKDLFRYVLAFLFFFTALSFKVQASENKSILDKSQIIIANKFVERFCSAKADHFFEGLENEKTLKYSYFKYIGLQNKEKFSKNMYKQLIAQIREKCAITDTEVREINKILFNKS